MNWTIPERARIGRVALRVNDLEDMTAFYEDVIGLQVLSDEAGRKVLGVDGTEILVLVEDSDAEPRRRAEAGLFHAAFRVPDRASLGDVLVRAEEKWELDGASDHTVSEALYLTDPEGNGLEVYCDRPRGDWEVTEEGDVKMPTLRLDLGDLREQAQGGEHAPEDTTVGHVHLEVSDIDASRRFYGDALGFRVRQEIGAALFLAAGDYHHHVGLNTWNGRTEPASGRGLAWYELVVPEKAVGEMRERCVKNGFDVEDTGHGFTASDPDGLHVRVRS